MSRMTGSVSTCALSVLVSVSALAFVPALRAQSPPAKRATAAPQKNDAEYTALIRKYLSDPRISTELVDHLPASSIVPTPLKFLGHIIGMPGELTHVAAREGVEHGHQRRRTRDDPRRHR